MTHTTDDESKEKKRARDRRYAAAHKAERYAQQKEYRLRPEVQARLREKNRQWRQENKARLYLLQKEWRRKLAPEVKARYLEQGREYVRRHKKERALYARAWEARRREALIGRPQPTCCDICGEEAQLICFDHCHKRGHPRGWLCSRCNLVLGEVKDDRDLLRKMIAYLDLHEVNQAPQLALPGV